MIRCHVCNKKSTTGLMECRCKNRYCFKHLLPEIHNCTRLHEFKEISFNKNKEKLMEEAKDLKYRETI